MADNETTADIIAEMRRRSDEAYKGSFNYPECQENQIEYDEASEWADRLDAAHRREIEEITYAYDPEKAAKSKAPDPVAYAIEGFKKDPAIMRMFRQSNSGDAVKLREACEALMSEIGGYSADGLEVVWCGISGKTIKKSRAALAAPPRNCDVGTAQEQIKRWQAFCNRYDDDCTGCPCEAADTWDCTGCFAKWAQMPYEEGGDK